MAASASCISLVVLVALATAASAQLSPTFYDSSCPGALAAIKSAVTAAGCDASVLLSGNEQNAGPNAGSLRGFGVIDGIKAQVEAVCKQTVSCADILAVAARDSVVALGGPSWTVPLGRRDSTGANAGLANSDIPGPGSSRAQLEAAFLKKGLDTVDMLGGPSWTVPLGRRDSTGANAGLANSDIPGPGSSRAQLEAAFLKKGLDTVDMSGGNGNLAPLDATTPNTFDNAYYTDLLSQKGLMHSDQVLFNGDTTDNTVRNFASNPAAFSSAFTTAMIKMGNIAPLTGAQGQIRLSCSKVNS
ncbi:Peroxidase 1 [Triticum urartu]|uniref:Peroxidase n=1 Tax=Triticum urartu TaxID=4572 RepID=M7ZMM2_TRIUA|nr:Peroxidase 1 [Triticum urartu]